MDENEVKNKLFQIVQEYLKPCPLIVWGSGATIPFGMSSMEDLKTALSIQEDGNLEEILSAIADQNGRAEYEEKIFHVINQKDSEFRQSLSDNHSQANHVKKMISYFYNAHPRLLNIITTNYDCVLEYILSYHTLPYSDGFSGKEFSTFDDARFKTKGCINLYKVHGSLRWYQGRYSYYNKMMDGIFPSRDKYQKAYQDPYRTIISKSDEETKNAKCFLCIGFGFNDEHLTPKIEEAINGGKPIVVIAKQATDSAKAKLSNSSKYVLIEQGSEENETKFSFKADNQEETTKLEGSYWNLEQFNQILGAN